MSNATRIKPLPPPSSYAVRERARRAETERVADRAARAHAGRCDCGLPATHGELCAACNTAHKMSVRNAFGGL